MRFRDLVDAAEYEKRPEKALLDAALLVRRAGVSVGLETLARDELYALVVAGERIAAEDALIFAQAFRAPAEVAGVFDGGAAKREAQLSAAVALSNQVALVEPRR